MALFEIYPIAEGKILGLLLIIVIFLITYYYLNTKGKIYIRRVPGLDAIEEAIGRSTEMGKPHFATFGVGLFGAWTLAAFSMPPSMMRTAMSPAWLAVSILPRM